ncbi:unnamed protein product [Merluccius merluccius]
MSNSQTTLVILDTTTSEGRLQAKIDSFSEWRRRNYLDLTTKEPVIDSHHWKSMARTLRRKGGLREKEEQLSDKWVAEMGLGSSDTNLGRPAWKTE